MLKFKDFKNLKEFKELIVTYRSITIEQLKVEALKLSKRHNVRMFVILNAITGFNYNQSCTLCEPCKKYARDCDDEDLSFCHYCFYVSETGEMCFSGDNEDTYQKIKEADNFDELYQAINARADYMESSVNEYEGADEGNSIIHNS